MVEHASEHELRLAIAGARIDRLQSKRGAARPLFDRYSPRRGEQARNEVRHFEEARASITRRPESAKLEQ
jgi:hypothetical protein